MNRRRFVALSTVLMAVVAGAVGGLALYSTYSVKAAAGLPEAVSYLPATSQAVFGMNVRKFVASPIYAKFEERHGQNMAKDLAELIAQTGVDPRRDLHYVIAAASAGERGKGAVIAVGQFNTAAITSFIQTKSNPIQIEYQGSRVLMFEEPG